MALKIELNKLSYLQHGFIVARHRGFVRDVLRLSKEHDKITDEQAKDIISLVAKQLKAIHAIIDCPHPISISNNVALGVSRDELTKIVQDGTHGIVHRADAAIYMMSTDLNQLIRDTRDTFSATSLETTRRARRVHFAEGIIKLCADDNYTVPLPSVISADELRFAFGLSDQ